MPIVATNVRGHYDLVKNGVNGFLFEVDDINKASKSIEFLHNHKEIYASQSKQSIGMAEKFDVKNVVPQYKPIFNII